MPNRRRPLNGRMDFDTSLRSALIPWFACVPDEAFRFHMSPESGRRYRPLILLTVALRDKNLYE